MAEFLQFLINYGYIVIFIWVLLDQLGLPIPAIPLMLAAGALAGAGHLSIYVIIFVAVLGAVRWIYSGISWASPEVEKYSTCSVRSPWNPTTVYAILRPYLIGSDLLHSSSLNLSRAYKHSRPQWLD